MSETSGTLTFANFYPTETGTFNVYNIGATVDHPKGVAHEMAAAFGFELTKRPEVENLGGLIDLVGRSKELQDNIEGVRVALETSDDAITIARGWAQRSGLLVPVDRLYSLHEKPEGAINLAIISGGVRNWMQRRANRLTELTQTRQVEAVLLAAGNRSMRTAEGPDVETGMTEADYMSSVIAPMLGELGLATELLRVDSGIGDEVMRATAYEANRLVGLIGNKLVAVVSNAGNWVQNGGQFLRAAQQETRYGFNVWGKQLEVVSDSFPLGTGNEPTATHQNPFSATGQIARNLQEFVRHS